MTAKEEALALERKTESLRRQLRGELVATSRMVREIDSLKVESETKGTAS